jgi:hypothetical protein
MAWTYFLLPLLWCIVGGAIASEARETYPEGLKWAALWLMLGALLARITL